MITRNSSYASKPQAARVRPSTKPTGLAAPQGFTRPTFSSTARSSPPRVIAPEVAQEISPPPPTPPIGKRPHDDFLLLQSTQGHSQAPLDARLDKDLVLAPYWYALREKGFESAAVLQTLSHDQAMRALELCGVDKIGHRWYILNKYCTTTTPTHGAPLMESSNAANELSAKLIYTPKSNHNFLDGALLSRRVEPLGAPKEQHHATDQLRSTTDDVEQPPEMNSPVTSSITLDSPSQGSPEGGGRGVLYRRLQRPKFVTKHKSSVSPRRKSPHSAVVGISKELLHPPEQHDMELHHDAHDPATAVRVAATIVPATPSPRGGWGAIASPPIANLHESSTYKTLVTLLGTPSIPLLGSTLMSDPPRRNASAAAGQRRRSTSPPSSDRHSSSTWVLEAARRRFLAPTYDPNATPPVSSTTAEAPLSPFVFSRPL
ncbi:Hypothetical protein, putative [Bodo saltans]|uniref:Uncharacterized protein n=1 Tax=Bodo saltans TaxID=75058 RepID=A0A0S4JGJ5_BODSA|nr:Hypothetical protein, putative [Bodo saltans]|eukprot:CUG89255.1 Hypothetical protein, putative [Bodo saltans]